MFDPVKFVERSVVELRRTYGSAKKVLAAVSGGVDSVTSAVLVRKALGSVVKAVYIDTGFMRLNEGHFVRDSLKELIDVEVIDRSSRFYDNLLGLEDAEHKRVVFRDTFYAVLSELVSEYGCDHLVQGTIKADIVETVGGVKTQHNVLSEELQVKYGVKVIEPLKDLYKHEVREVARYLGIPETIVNRQPFPGPGLLVRTVGRFTLEKLDVVRRATDKVEKFLRDAGASQYFAAAWDFDLGPLERLCLSSGKCVEFSKFKTLATGVKEGKRVYAAIGLLSEDLELRENELLELVDKSGVSRFVLLLNESSSGRYFVSIRAVSTLDYMTASVVKPPEKTLRELASTILEIEGVKAVGFDITPKPPATIEYE
ncbi:MAG: GMP synthase [Sulfolobales archaeon]